MSRNKLLILLCGLIIAVGVLSFAAVKLFTGTEDPQQPNASDNAGQDNISPTPVAKPAPIDLEAGLLITFNEDDKARFTNNFYTNGKSSVAWTEGDGISHNDDGYALKGTHKEGQNYTSADNAIRFALPVSLEPGGIYRVTAWFYVPKEGNEGKAALAGPAIVLNGDYANANGPSKFPDNNAGNIPVGKWHKFEVTLPVRPTAVYSIDFRFFTNEEPNHPDVWYIDDIEIKKVV